MALEAKEMVGGSFDNRVELLRVRYDFAREGGAVGDYDVLEAEKDCVIQLKGIHGKTTCTSGGAAVLDLGKGDGGTEFKSDLGFASVAADAALGPDTEGTRIKLAAGEKIVLGIEAAALTAGVFDMVFEVIAF